MVQSIQEVKIKRFVCLFSFDEFLGSYLPPVFQNLCYGTEK